MLLRWSTGDAANHNLGQSLVALKKVGLKVKERFRKESLQALQSCVNVLKAKHRTAFFRIKTFCEHYSVSI